MERSRIPISEAVSFGSKELKSQSVFPWINRSQEEWLKLVTTQEAAILLFYALRVEGIANSLNTKSSEIFSEIIGKYRLEKAFGAFWKAKDAQLFAEIEKVKLAERSKYYVPEGENGSELIAVVKQLFSDYRLSNYILARRQFEYTNINHRNVPRSRRKKSKKNELNKICKSLGINRRQIIIFEATFAQLIETLYPLAKEKAIKLANRRGEDVDDWLGIAGLHLTISVINFNWDTMSIDPDMTLIRFKRSFYSTLFNPVDHAKDTINMEQQLADDIQIATIDADMLDYQESLAQVKAVIAGFTENKIQQQIIELHLLEGYRYSEITEIFGISRHIISTIIQEFKKYYQDRNQSADNPSAIYFFDRLKGNKDMYQEIFEKRKKELSPARITLINLLFDNIQSDASSTWEVIAQEYNSLPEREGKRKITTQYVMRSIKGSFNYFINGNTSEIMRVSTRLPNKQEREKNLTKVQSARNNLKIWSSLTEVQQQILLKLYLEDGGLNKTDHRIARELGIHPSTVMRNNRKAIMTINRLLEIKEIEIPYIIYTSDFQK